MLIDDQTNIEEENRSETSSINIILSKLNLKDGNNKPKKRNYNQMLEQTKNITDSNIVNSVFPLVLASFGSGL